MLALFLWLAAGRDWLGADFERELAAKAEATCGRPFRVSLGQTPPVKAIRALVGGEEGKEIYVQFLKDRYGYTIARVNEIYGREATSFTELLTDGFQGVDEQKREVVQDDVAFGEVLRARWTAAAGRGGKRCGVKATPVVRQGEKELMVDWNPV